MNHASNALSSGSVKDWLAAMEANGSRDFLNPYRFPVDIEQLADDFLSAFGFAAYMTAKHPHLRLA